MLGSCAVLNYQSDRTDEPAIWQQFGTRITLIGSDNHNQIKAASGYTKREQQLFSKTCLVEKLLSSHRFGAGDGNRTHDIQLGKLSFCH